jgi:hypothetical protein
MLVDVGTGLNENFLDDQFRDGWSSEDLESFGGEFSLLNGSLMLPGSSDLDGAPVENLKTQIGQARILLLYLPHTKSNTTQSQTTGNDIQITRLVAGRIMEVTTGKNGTTIILQPAVVATRTAMLDEEALYSGQTQGNAYIYRLAVTR